MQLIPVVGGGGNKFTELRRNLKRNAKASQRTDKLLSAVELRGFYIKLFQSKLLIYLVLSNGLWQAPHKINRSLVYTEDRWQKLD